MNISFEHAFFKDYDCASTSYVYNSAGSTTIADGALEVSDWETKTLLFKIATLASASVTIIIHGKIKGEWGKLISEAFTAAHSTGEAKMYNITEACSHISVGLKIATNGVGDVLTVVGRFESKKG